MSGVVGPAVRWVNPLRMRTWHTDEGWTASYRWGSSAASVSGCGSRREAVRRLRHSLRMRVAMVDGQWVEV